MRSKKLVKEITLNEHQQVVALCIHLFCQLHYDRENVLRAVCAFLGYKVEKLP